MLPPDTKVFLFHIDVTFAHRVPICRPALVQALAKRGVRVLNPRVTDISKRSLQEYCRELGLNTTAATRRGDPDDLLIVKTNLNAGGWAERLLTAKQRRLAGLGDPPRAVKGQRDYKILPRKKIKPSWWDDRQLVVERYIQNRENRVYKIYLLLDRLTLSAAVDPSRIKTMEHASWRVTSLLTAAENGIQVLKQASDYPERLLDQALPFVRYLSLDFGSIEIVADDAGECYIVDLNATPSPPSIRQEGFIEHLQAFNPGAVLTRLAGGPPPRVAAR